MSYIILVTGLPYGTQNAITAFLFIKSIILLNFCIKKVFFYASGVYNANCMMYPPEHEFNILQGWINLKKKYKIPLCVCPSSAYRRGILLNEFVSDAEKIKENFSSSFQWMTLSELSYSMHDCDRIIQF
ncbi:Sulfurtransferase TusD [Buchnera aphidicola (Cinara kochiana kochiana)]|uniref:Sulfurtransferase TusD n=1 Tax=Buchnera aphidicola (Cinara kochiana kochiana) TaxID=2518976 RepID=A0A451D623_9GAMM|nr:sulfurtransferase complex subunit TusD [Buchnera aphidicola]VFP81256.1 Sulfurtransferase TusD [Buchnera aphidicola (Cinara kochiana kochiana)]